MDEASDFGSVRRFNDAFRMSYRLTPGQLRKCSQAGSTPSSTITMRLGYRPPLRFGEVLAFFRDRALAGVEVVEEASYTRSVRLPAPGGGEVCGWVRVKGIGPWTANYIAMRVLSHPDAFLESDAGVAHALPDLTPKQRLALAEAWRPWRSYAVMMLWNSL